MVFLRNLFRIMFIGLQFLVYKKLYGMNIHKNSRISLKAKLDKTYPKGIYIGEESFIAAGANILAHDFTRDIHTNTLIGKRCFIGVNSIVLPGITIGDEVIVGSGSVVTKNVPSNCIIAGNPAQIIKTNISTHKYGQLISNRND